MKINKNYQILLALLQTLFLATFSFAQLQNTNVLNEPPDISKDFEDYKNTYYLADELVSFDPVTGKGSIKIPEA
ncbi:MAG: hypothetical protein U5K51_04940 [Flavobacteriaceae bacterium]|nr:hypothetical protein [Flavobacteriaceae bacterium]